MNFDEIYNRLEELNDHKDIQIDENRKVNRFLEQLSEKLNLLKIRMDKLEDLCIELASNYKEEN